jgi:hypothetical protein
LLARRLNLEKEKLPGTVQAKQQLPKQGRKQLRQKKKMQQWTTSAAEAAAAGEFTLNERVDSEMLILKKSRRLFSRDGPQKKNPTCSPSALTRVLPRFHSACSAFLAFIHHYVAPPPLMPTSDLTS